MRGGKRLFQREALRPQVNSHRRTRRARSKYEREPYYWLCLCCGTRCHRETGRGTARGGKGRARRALGHGEFAFEAEANKEGGKGGAFGTGFVSRVTMITSPMGRLDGAFCRDSRQVLLFYSCSAFSSALRPRGKREGGEEEGAFCFGWASVLGDQALTATATRRSHP